jgi:putative protein-disulfide isomerase
VDRVIRASLQNAFCVDGLSLSGNETYRKIAAAFGFDVDAVVAAFHSATGRSRLRTRSADEGGGFPRLLAVRGSDTTLLARGCATAEDVEQRIAPRIEVTVSQEPKGCPALQQSGDVVT